MMEFFRIFSLIMYKNFIVRKRQWKMIFFFQMVIPLLLFLLTQAVRAFSVETPIKIPESTYYPIRNETELMERIQISYTYLYFIPNNKDTTRIIKQTRSCFPVSSNSVRGFDTEKEMMDAYIKQKAALPMSEVLVVVFDQYKIDATQRVLKYKIRHSGIIPNELYQNALSQEEGYGELCYTHSIPFVQLQICVDRVLINDSSTYPLNNVSISIQQMPYPPYIKIDNKDISLREIAASFALIAFLIPLCNEVGFVAREKYLGINILMNLNGIKLYQNLLSWLVSGLMSSTLYLIPITVLFKNTLSSNVEPFLYYGNSFLFWLAMTIHIAHLLAFGYHIAAYFSKPRFVTVVLMIINLGLFSLIGYFIREKSYNILSYLGLVFPNIFLIRIFEEVNSYEISMTGIQWSNLFFVGNPVFGVTGSLGFIMIFSLLGAVLHFILAIYCNALFPGAYGVSKNPLYFLDLLKNNKIHQDREAGCIDYTTLSQEDFETVASGVLIPGIQIRNLKKAYSTSCLRKSMVHALKGVSVDFYKGQITALLGQNGAGKTTLMSILTGLTSKTDGQVFINELNIETNLNAIQNNLGLCPQENMVFPDLNVYEQIEFFGLLKHKNLTRSEVRTQVNSLLEKLNILEKKNFIADKLSGGQKRRLCLGMALIGGASTLILDEPTSGMDPETRRDTWDLLLKMRGEKTILLSTHNMEEADTLGDRVAIIHSGRLKSYGTSMFLKKKYGQGRIEITLSTESWCSSEKVIAKFSSDTEQVSANSEKIILSAPYSESLPKSLDRIEAEKRELGITGISVSMITLEQVFLNVIKKEENNIHLNELLVTSARKLEGFQLYKQTILALLYKKIKYTQKDLKNLLMIFGFPVISIVLMAIGNNVSTPSLRVLPLSLDMYRNPKSFYSADIGSFALAYKNSMDSFQAYSKQIIDTSVSNAILNHSIEDIADYRNNFIISAEFNNTDDIVHANGFYSGIAQHGVPLTVNLISNTLLKMVAGDDTSLEISVQLLPLSSASITVVSSAEELSISRVLTFCTFFFGTVALFVVHPLLETSTKVKQLQRMTGVTSASYWAVMFFFDFAIYLVTVMIALITFCTMDVILGTRMFHFTEVSVLTLMLIFFGFNALILAYIFSFINKSRNTVTTIMSLAPIGLAIIQYLLHQVIASFSSLNILHKIQKKLFRLVPHISLFHGLFAFFYTAEENARCRRLPQEFVKFLEIACLNAESKYRDKCCDMKCGDGDCENPLPYFNNFEGDINLDECMIYLAVTPFIYFVILIMLEEKFFQRLFLNHWRASLKVQNTVMDDQVKKEKEIISYEIKRLNSEEINRRNNEAGAGVGAGVGIAERSSPIKEENKNLFLAYELSKYYGKIMAIKDVNFRVKEKECFGLLGVNGAGKSTTFRMLTGEEFSNSGIMYLGKSSVHSDRKDYLAQMGYCPQSDALLKSLNAFDHLRLFARLRGVPELNVELEVNKWINRLNLTACMKQPSGTYSGGNKRRLNIAMALIGSPTLVLLDEPTTGVDPAARRSLWSVLQSCQAAGQAIILTSHSMEECEALCNRLVIMMKGEFVCVGASQELKQRFGAGHNILIKIHPDRSSEDFQEIKDAIQSRLNCELRDENLGFLEYHVQDNASWEAMYEIMNGLKGRFACIEDFAVLSASLEQLFIQFARGATTTASLNTNSNDLTSQSVIV
ncbi:phospholipid-transporting ATPase ABCA3-like [Prorops nasuta]|uniref:phospholipid-transporting ATPase ABCA3-like n=1 Tax=Prorops nasuta TaxID=863751 RepID=UPI0034CFBC5D